MSLTLSQLNELNCTEFVSIIGPVFEHSSWIAEKAWSKKPFAGIHELHSTMCNVVRGAGLVKQIALVRAHPDLVGRAALAGTLTRESTNEQAGAGLNALSLGEISLFQKQNEAYLSKFGFPFVICARINRKETILAGYEKRLQNTREQEIQIALEEIFKIAEFRLCDLISD
jgi:2-oxo-4-hydroxy-4-carboxy-5-ureidoimidazoline decarboxylase